MEVDFIRYPEIKPMLDKYGFKETDLTENEIDTIRKLVDLKKLNEDNKLILFIETSMFYAMNKLREEFHL